MDENQYGKLSYITLKHTLKQVNNAFIAVSADCYWQFGVYYISATNIMPYCTCMLQMVPGCVCMLSVCMHSIVCFLNYILYIS